MAGTKPRRSWLLIVSLCLNVALVAAIAVVAWRVAHFDILVDAGGPLSPRAVMAAFPDRRPAIQAIIDTHRGRIAALRRGTARARYDAFRVFGAPDYTPEKMATALDGVVAADGALERDVVAASGASLATLSPAERQALAAHVEARDRSWFHRLWRRDGVQ